MTMSSTNFTMRRQPISLGLVLEIQGDINEFPLLDCLAQAVVVERRAQTSAERRLVADWCREQVATWITGSAPRDLPILPWTFETVTALLWLAECLDDAELASRFEATLPARLKTRFESDLGSLSAASGRRVRS